MKTIKKIMINKNKILKAVQEGIQTGFKFSSNSAIDDSSYVDFSDSKIDKVQSLDATMIKEQFKQYMRQYMTDYVSDDVFNYYERFESILHCKDINDFLDEKFKNAYLTDKVVILRILYDFYIKYDFKYHVIKNKNTLQQFILRLRGVWGDSNVNLNIIDVSQITNMSNLFVHSSFNGDISEWDVSNVDNMESMFSYTEFNGDISKWNVSNVKNMSRMFKGSKFNGDISEWDVSNVTDMSYMFDGSMFNNDISKWKISNDCNITQMFAFTNH